MFGPIRILLSTCTVLLVCAVACEAANLDRTGTQWAPFIEWELENGSFSGNPFDLQATVRFVHTESGETRTTGMFFKGNQTWGFRFTATRPGAWNFQTSSQDSDLDRHTGTITVTPNDSKYGFVTSLGSKWARPFGRSGRIRPFTPQLVMYGHPRTFYHQPKIIDTHIQQLLVGHGFNGFHVPVYCRWFDIDQDRSDKITAEDPNPDPRTFEALELLITKVHDAGGIVHLWAWGDESRRQTPIRWGINGKVDQRLQRYIAARLGPLPGWTMGYGFDLWEWVEGEQLASWHHHMHEEFGWHHMLGARARKNRLSQLCETLDYSSYEQHRPEYATYVETINRRPNKPSFSEDRFRIRQSQQYRDKDYTEEMTRRGLWHSTMAGGVANIWGRLDGDLAINMGRGMSKPYENAHWIKTHATFFRDRTTFDMKVDDRRTDGICLVRSATFGLIAYKENCRDISLDLSSIDTAQPAVAIDTKQPYRELDLGQLEPKLQTWKAPHESDWAIAVGDFTRPRESYCRLTPMHTGVCQIGKDHVLGAGYTDQQRMPFVIYSFLVEGPHGERALVDLGPKTVDYCNRMFRHHGFFRDLGPTQSTNQRYPDDIAQPHGNVFRQLGHKGISPNEIDHILFSHLHADHHGMDNARNGGAAEDFPRAMLHVSAIGWKDNLARRTDAGWNSYVDFAFSDFIERQRQVGRVRLVDSHTVFPGLRTVYLGGHSECSQAVLVDTAEGTAIFASDELYLYQLLEENILPKILTTEHRYRNAIRRLVELVESNDGILIPSHDSRVWQAYETTGDGWLTVLRQATRAAVSSFHQANKGVIE